MLTRPHSERHPDCRQALVGGRGLHVFVFCALSVMTLVGCKVNVQGRQRPLVYSDGIRGELEAVVEHRSDEQGTDANRRKSDTQVFEERVRLMTEGDIYHPDFLNYDATVGVGLAQQHFDAEDVSGWDDETLDEYNLFAQFLRAKPLSGTANASKSEDLIARQFLGSLRTERQTEGGSLFFRSSEWPMTFQYSNNEISQDGLTSLTSDFFRREDERFRYSVHRDFSESSRLRFDFDRTDSIQESVGALVDTETDTYTFSHDYGFGTNKEHRLDSFLNFVDQTGSFEFENLRWQERLRLQHTPDLLSKYDLRYTDLERDTLSSEEIRGQAGIEHHLYESLVTTADAFVSTTDLSEQGTLDQQGGILGLNYRKQNPWGMLLGTYAGSYTMSQQSGGGGTGVVSDESHTATEAFPILLERTNIDVSSIRVKDIDGSLFQENDDYTITESGGRVWLNITTLGTIPPNFTEGQEFFVDYTFFIEPEREEETLRHNVSIRQRFNNGVSLYYAYRRQDQDVSSTLADLTPDEYTVNTIAADYTHKGLFLLAEYSEEESTQIPSTSTKLVGQYRWLLGPATSASAGVSHQWLDFGEPDARDVQLLKAEAKIFSRLTDAYSISLGTGYRDEDDTRFGVTRGFQLDTELQYRYRQVSARLGAELSFLSRRDDETNSVFLYLQVQRRF
ncbi:MAG: hypothetical protein ACYTAS_00700 [Planctomycetota bacterium]